MEINHWRVYIVRCVDGTYYTGATNNLTQRIEKHNQGLGAKYTLTRRPVTLVYFEELSDRSSALKREHQIKKCTRKEKTQLMKNFIFPV